MFNALGTILMSALFCSGGYKLFQDTTEDHTGMGTLLIALGLMMLFYGLVEADAVEGAAKDDK